MPQLICLSVCLN
uniref:Uncharacterized protein n=1 Tax=Oryza glumipatula TaxID=40148 RepID=A0A0E0ABH5_9ORYZ